MPPLEPRRQIDCFPALNATSAGSSYSIIDRNLTRSGETETNTHEDMQALMYIVCVLLFYSIGIVVGIITYLKREKQEIEESKMFDEFFTIINERQPYNCRLIKVQEVIARLDQLQLLKTGSGNTTVSTTTTRPNELSGKLYYNPSSRVQTDKSASGITAPSPLDSSCGIYETLSNETPVTMDVTKKQEEVTSEECRREEGYVSDSDPFQNKRLSQVVAQILDSNTDIGPEDVFDDVDGAYYDDDSICTDFINYKEEPKNKELFRTSCKDSGDFDDERPLNSESSGKESEWPDPPKMIREFVGNKTGLLDEVDGSTTLSPTTTTFDRDDVEKELSPDLPPPSATGFRWSVTSV